MGTFSEARGGVGGGGQRVPLCPISMTDCLKEGEVLREICTAFEVSHLIWV